MTVQIRLTDVFGGVAPDGTPAGIVGGFLPRVPFLGWRQYSVAQTYTDPSGVEFPAVRLEFLSGPSEDTATQVINRETSYFVDRAWPFNDPKIVGSFPGLAWYLLDPSSMALVAGPLLPLGYKAGLTQAQRDAAPARYHVLQWFDHTTPITGPYIGVQVAREPSPEFPTFVSGHPVDLATYLLDQKGEAWDATTAAAVKAALGPECGIEAAITSGDQSLQDVVDAFAAAYGFAIRRSGTTGAAEFVRWRDKIGPTLPAPVLDMNSLRSLGGPTYDLSDATRVNRVRVRGQSIQPWTPGAPETVTIFRPFSGVSRVTTPRDTTNKPASGLVVNPAEVVYDYSSDGSTPDAERYGEQEITVDVQGAPAVLTGSAGQAFPLNLQQWGEYVARMVFDAHARGRQMCTAVGIRNTDFDQALLGAAVTVDFDHGPNAQLGQSPTSQRGGQRPFRVVSRDESASGHPQCQLADEGTGVPFGTAPTIASVGVVRASNLAVLYQVAVGNAATLAASGVQVEFEVRVFTPGDPIDLTDPGLRYTVLDSTGWTDNPQPVLLGDFPAGHTVFFRVRGWLMGGGATAWSSWWSLGGEVTGPQTTLSDLQITAITDDGATLTWSYDEAPPVGSVLVQIRETLVGGAYSLVDTLAAGTETYDLTGLDADKGYDVRLVLDNGGEYGDVLLGSFVTLAGSISSLVVGSPTADGVPLSWTNTHPSALVRVSVKLDTETDYRLYQLLPAGSTQLTLIGLASGTDYDVAVVLVAGSATIGVTLTGSFTTLGSGSAVTLTTPTNAEAFTDGAGTYGLHVVAVFGPFGMRIVFEEAVETAVGSGTPGAYAEVARVVAVQGGRTTFTGTAPNDGKLRYLRAYATFTGYTDSGTTTALAVDPWDASFVPVVNVTPHAATHENGGADEIDVTGLSGKLADPQNAGWILDVPVDDTNKADGRILVYHDDSSGERLEYEDDASGGAHASTHYDGGADPVDVTQLDGFPGGSTTFLRGDGTFATPGSTPGSNQIIPGYFARQWSHETNAAASGFQTVNLLASFTGVGSTTADIATDGIWLRHTTGAATIGTGTYQQAITSNVVRRRWRGVHVMHMKTYSDVTNLRIWFGLFNADPTATDDLAGGHLAAFRYSTAVDGTAFWRTCTKDGSTQEVQTTSVAVATDTPYLFWIELDTSEVRFYIDGVLVSTHSTNIPGLDTNMGQHVGVTNLSAATHSFRYGRQWGLLRV